MKTSNGDHADEFYFEDADLRLWEKRHFIISQILINNKYYKIADLGCNDGKFLKRLTNDNGVSFSLLVGVDIDDNALETSKRRLEPDATHYIFKNERKRKLEIKLIKSNILNPSPLLKEMKFDAITAIEVIEHLYKEDLPMFESNVFDYLQPKCVIVTTPNYEFNAFFMKNAEDTVRFRHYDHKYEFTRNEFNEWCYDVCFKYNYEVEITGIGLPKNGDNSRGYCTQMARFSKIHHPMKILKKESILSEKTEKFIENLENNNSIEYAAFIYPYSDSCDNVKRRIIQEIKYGYNFLKYYGNSKKKEEEYNNGYISIEKICSLNKIEVILQETQKKIFEILTIFDLERENIVLNSKRTHLKINYKLQRSCKI